MTKRISSDKVARFLAKTPLLIKCQHDQLVALVRTSRQRACSAGEVILNNGEVATNLGFVLQGQAALMQVNAASGVKTRVEKIRPGDFYGEVGFLMGSASPLAVAATKDSHILEVKREDMAPLMSANPNLGVLMAKAIAGRFLRVCLLGARSSTIDFDGPPPANETPASPPPEVEEGQIRWVDAGDYSITPGLLEMLPTQLIRNHRLLPLKLTGKVLTVGLVNPRSPVALADLRRVLQSVDPEVVAISMDDFNSAFVRLKLDRTEQRGPGAAEAVHGALSYRVEQRKEEEKKGQLIIGDEVISLFDRILLDAVKYGASDIHVEPDATGVRVRYRVSGALVDRDEFLADSYAAPLVARIKVLSELDITEHRLPQDGRISAQVGRRELNLRVSTMAISRGEKAVIRLIDPEDVMRPMHQIFLDPEAAKEVAAVLGEPHGAIVVAGPTGSGKSSTLYSMLNNRHATRPDNNIVTVEDPVEYLLPGITQVSVNPRVRMDFATVLRGLMRQDPDVIMIGELRDKETAGIMVEAALTGHLVVTSTHGNDAMAVIQRLLHFGLDPVIFSQAISCLVVQRLTGRLCPNCVEEREVAPALVENLVSRKVLSREGASRLPAPVGCPECNRTGYVGRVAVQEVLRLDDTLRGMLAGGASQDDLVREATRRGRFIPFSKAAAYLISRRILAPSDALLITSS